MPKANYWIKLFHEVLDDPKMFELTGDLYRRAIELFLLAGVTDDKGKLPPVKTIAFRLRITKEQLISDIEQLVETGIITFADGVYIVTNFEKRQAPATNAERQKTYRQARHKEAYYGNESVTQSVTQSENNVTQKTQPCYIDKIRREEIRKDKTSGAGAVFTLYENNIGTISSIVSEKIKEAVEEFPPDWIESAIQVAVENNVRKWSYIRAILDRWQVEGFKSNGKKPKAEEEVDMKGYTDATIYN